MTGNKLLLDTNVIIDLWDGNTKVIDYLEQQHNLYIPATVLGELYVGAFRSVNKEKHLAAINEFLEHSTVFSSDSQTAEYYGSVKATLLNKGKPIPENDIWIAATALQHQLPLYTHDKHFKEVEGLQLDI